MARCSASGRMLPLRPPSSKPAALVCAYAATGHNSSVLAVDVTDDLMFTGSKGNHPVIYPPARQNVPRWHSGRMLVSRAGGCGVDSSRDQRWGYVNVRGAGLRMDFPFTCLFQNENFSIVLLVTIPKSFRFSFGFFRLKSLCG